MALHSIFYIFVLIVFSACPLLAISANQSHQAHFFNIMKTTLAGNALSDWDVNGGRSSPCNFTGVGCNDRGYVERIDITGWSISGQFPAGICLYLPQLRVLRLGFNYLHGDFVHSINNCSLLEELDLSYLYLGGTLPDFSTLNYLRILNIPCNHFRGEFPLSVINLTNLDILNFGLNPELKSWVLPKTISRLSKLKVLGLRLCNLHGPIPSTIGNITSLVELDLSKNFLSGEIPAEVGLLKNLQMLEFFYNSHLYGNIPEELGNLTELVDWDMSGNNLTGNVPESVCRLPKLKALLLYKNHLTGKIPNVVANSTALRIFSIYQNHLTGEVPHSLGMLSPMYLLDLSENRLSGPLPTEVCKGGNLLYFLVLDNMFSGQLPDSYAKCKTLLRFRVNNNRFEGSIPEGLWGLPHVSIIDLSYNNFSGSIKKTIGLAKNLSQLFLQSNKFSGVLPHQISKAINLVKIDVSNNLISGPVPSQIGYLTKLNLLMLQGNMLNSSIPNSLSLLKSLNVLDLSNNLLTGNVPESLSVLLPNFMNFSNNRLSGSIPLPLIKGGLLDSFSGNPSLCIPVYISSHQNFPICSQTYNRKRLNFVLVIDISVVTITVGILLFLVRKFYRERVTVRCDTTSSSFTLYEVKSFHQIIFSQEEIIEGLVDDNIVGRGGFGTVYKIELSSMKVVAVKKLSSTSENQLVLDKEFESEVDTLGLIRHKNIIKLYCILSSPRSSLLVYEYMPNGNLWEALHTDNDRINLNWSTRYNIALGVAQGLAYLHHNLSQPIIHRDIKSTNILLDDEYQPKVADFGLAKLLQCGGKDSTTTAVAGTFGYLAPEYAYTSRATTKCDVYSFGVVLLELVTGKKPVEEEFGEGKNIIDWVARKVGTDEGIMEALDHKLSGCCKNEMVQVLQIAHQCTLENTALRPTMKDVVQLLTSAESFRVEA
ncbi:receptor protein-tyrosine kinase CEPR1 [Ricinus communis]|uniref:Receptor protein kinase, putative n=1 Tax=Ricinus communis TaxID=3988 RepID=B9R6R6_RICCO|nr:receptor protein-tyrosine kinase CEPR1 [Ricinus communis]EEF52196.1 receptor protein kinase, putative [Ricinus communis]|eukprot:XP_002510009.1 receptor protein-tyrosine kinase CEPR1 [Ricinus communis]